jgi:CheY-like chemotaxis protein
VILVVDDEKPLVDMMTQILERLGYTVVGKTGSIDALETFSAEPGRFDLVITDYAMPNMTGKELAQALMAVKPDIPVILCTGFSENIDAESAKSMGIKEFVMKPVVRSEIAATIRNVLDKKEIMV